MRFLSLVQQGCGSVVSMATKVSDETSTPCTVHSSTDLTWDPDYLHLLNSHQYTSSPPLLSPEQPLSFSAKTRRLPNVGLMLERRRRPAMNQHWLNVANLVGSKVAIAFVFNNRILKPLFRYLLIHLRVLFGFLIYFDSVFMCGQCTPVMQIEVI